MMPIKSIIKRGQLKENWTIIVFSFFHLLIFVISAVCFNLGDTSIYFQYASKIFQGQLPYLDFNIEYPPLSLLTFILPQTLTSDLYIYSQLFTLEMLFIDLIGLVLIIALARHWGYSLWRILSIYTLTLVLLLPVVSKRYDLLPAILVLFAFYAFLRGWNKASWAALALGTLAKLYPAILVPLFAFIQFQGKDYKRLIEGSLVFLFIFLLFTVPWLMLSPGGFISSFGYHGERGLQTETTYASFLLMGNILHLIPLNIEWSYGSWNIVSSAADVMVKISPLLTILGLILVYWIYTKNLQKEFSREPNPRAFPLNFPLVNYLLLVMLVFILTSKVFSPQFLIWLCPFVPFIKGIWRQTSLWIFIAICALTTYVYPVDYSGLINVRAPAVLVLFQRNILLIIMTYFLLKWKSPDRVLNKPIITKP